MHKKVNAKRNQAILLAAEELFYKKGYSDITMDKIAQKSKITKRTLYKYFTSKNDLYLAVALKGFNTFLNYLRQAPQKNVNGSQKVSQMILMLSKFMNDFPTSFTVMLHFGAMVKQESKYFQKWQKMLEKLAKQIIEAVKEGHKDKSIRSSFKTEKDAICLLMMMSGFFYVAHESNTELITQKKISKKQFLIFAMEVCQHVLK